MRAGGLVVLALGVLVGVVAVLCAAPRAAWADAVEAELILLTTHLQDQRDADVERYGRRLDRNGVNVLTPGIEVSYEWDLVEPLWRAKQARVTFGMLSDSAERRMAYLAVLARWEVYASGKFGMSVQVGPGFLCRETWRVFPEYHGDNALRETKGFLPGYEWAVLPLGSVDLLYAWSADTQLVWSIFPGVPYVITQMVGIRQQF